jgi:hypothetical protein
VLVGTKGLDEANLREQVKRESAAEAKAPLLTVEWWRVLTGGLNQVRMVGERSVSLRRCSVRNAGGIRSANADMSSDKGCEKHPRRKPKVSCATFIGAG